MNNKLETISLQLDNVTGGGAAVQLLGKLGEIRENERLAKLQPWDHNTGMVIGKVADSYPGSGAPKS